MRNMILAATAMMLVLAGGAQAQNNNAQPGPDPFGYYSQKDHDGYYDREGNYIRFDGRKDTPDNQSAGRDQNGYEDYDPPPYREGSYEDSCRRNNAAGGTLFGALAGGLIGDAASHGRGGAVIGGVILGGMLGNALTSDLPCEDHAHAFHVYADGLNGNLGERYEWRNDENQDYGYFIPEREFRRDGRVCRSFSETTYRHGKPFARTGAACRMHDGNWRFD